MEGTQKIIDEIISSAKQTAAAMEKEAREELDADKARLADELEKAKAAALEKYKLEADAVYSGRVKLGELEAGKVLLDARQKCVAAVYDGVREKILGAPDKEYLALLGKLIAECCENGDEVIAAKSDSKRVTAAWLKKIADGAKVKLTLSKTYGDFAGGVILRNARYDRDLTVDEIVESLKERTVGETVKNLGI